MRCPGRVDITPATITRVILPVIYAGTSLRLLAVLRQSRDPAVRDMAVALAAIAAAGSTLPPSVLATFDDVLGDANYARALSQLGTVVAAGTGSNAMQRSAYGEEEATAKVRTRRRHMAETVVLMAVLFARDRSIAGELQCPTNSVFRAMPALYWVAFSKFMVEAAGEIARLSLCTSRLTDEAVLRRGLRCVSAGTGVLAAFYGQLAIGVLGKTVTSGFPGPLRGIPAQAIIGGCAAAVAFGASLPGAAWRARRVRRVAGDARMSAGLRALWRPLQRRRPDLCVHVSPLTPGVQLHRRVIEILDGIDVLEHRHDPTGKLYREAEAVGRREGLGGDDVTALYRAAMVRYTEQTSGVPGQPHEASARTDVAPLTGGTVAEDWRQEARRLLKTASLLRDSSLPDQVAERIRDTNRKAA